MSNVSIQNCPHGYGVFAKKSFSQGQVIADIVGGMIIPKRTCKYDMLLSNGKWWSYIRFHQSGYWSNFLDHSRDPNAEVTELNMNKMHAQLIAKASIPDGYEIFIDYARIVQVAVNP